MIASIRKHLTAQGRLQTGHQQCRGNSLPRYISDSNGDMRRAELNKVIVVAADGTRGLANGLNLDARHRRQSTRKKLVLHFASDGYLVLQAPALVFHFDELADGAGHPVERFAQL